MSEDKTNPIYLENPTKHLNDLYKFRDLLETKILGEQDPEWRGELEFVHLRTKQKIREIAPKVL